MFHKYFYESISLLLLVVLALLLWIDGQGVVFTSLRVVVGSVVLLFLPGWWITAVAFAQKEIDLLERIALSFAFSISVVPLLVFYLNLAGLKITQWLVFVVVAVLVVGCVIFSRIKKQPVGK